MQQKRGKLKFLRCLIVVAFLPLLIAGLWWYTEFSDGFFVSNDGDERRIFPAISIEPIHTPLPSSQTVNLYIDTSAAMKGFIHQERTGCVGSAYVGMLNRMGSAFRGWNLRINEFNGIGIQTVQQMNNLLMESAYEHEGSEGNSLLNALDMVQQSGEPAIIITELEKHTTALTTDTQWIKTAFKDIFETGKSISVIRYVTAYSGILVRYAGAGISYTYGLKKAAENTVQLQAGQQYEHHLPRAFYALIIGKSEVCDLLQSTLTDVYNSACQEAASSETSKIHGTPALDAYQNEQSYTLFMPDSQVLWQYAQTDTNDANILVDTDGLDNVTDRFNAGIERWELPHTQGADTSHRVTFTIIPSYTNSEQTVLLSEANCEVEIEKMADVWEYRKDDTVDPLPENYLVARGNRLIRTEAQKIDSDGFQVQYSLTNDGRVQIFVDMNQGILEKGVYRVQLHVSGTMDSLTMANSVAQTLDGYTISTFNARNQASALVGKINTELNANPALKTVELESFLNQLRNGYNETRRQLELAEIIFELNII